MRSQFAVLTAAAALVAGITPPLVLSANIGLRERQAASRAFVAGTPARALQGTGLTRRGLQAGTTRDLNQRAARAVKRGKAAKRAAKKRAK